MYLPNRYFLNGYFKYRHKISNFKEKIQYITKRFKDVIFTLPLNGRLQTRLKWQLVTPLPEGIQFKIQN